MILVKSHRDACCCSARTFQTPTWKLIAASAIHHLLKKIKKIQKFCFLKWQLLVSVKPVMESCGRRYVKTWSCLALSMPYMLRDCCLQIWLFFCHLFLSSTWRVRRVQSSEGRSLCKDIMFIFFWVSLLHEFMLWSFECQKFRLETCCFLWAEINFLYLHSPLKIQMLVSNSSGYVPSKISDQFS